MPKYFGPADVFVFKGKEYHPGDDMPISRAEIAHYFDVGTQHRWEGGPPYTNVVVVSPTAEVHAFDDRGQMGEAEPESKPKVAATKD